MRLTVVVGDRGAAADQNETISLGRSTTEATLKLDVHRADSSLSRTTAVFASDTGAWQIINVASGARIAVAVEGGLRATLTPGASPLTLPTPCAGQLKIQTAASYVVDFTIVGEPVFQELPDPSGGTTTVQVADAVGLSDDQRLFLVALAEPRLLDPDVGAWNVASTQQLRDRLALTAKQIESLINELTIKFTPYIPDLMGTNAGRATTRRHQMVDYAIRSGCITQGDLYNLHRDYGAS